MLAVKLQENKLKLYLYFMLMPTLTFMWVPLLSDQDNYWAPNLFQLMPQAILIC
jgi:hypothetical protein